MEQATVFDKLYIRKTALIGTEHLPDSVRERVSKFSRREFPIFKSRLEALNWLTQD